VLENNSVDPKFLAYLFEAYFKKLKRQGIDLVFITENLLKEIFANVKKRDLPNEAVFLVLDYIAGNGKDKPVDQIFESLNLVPLSESEVIAIVNKKIDSLNGDKFKSERSRVEHIIGQIKTATRGRFSSNKLPEIVASRLAAI
jgi:Glu-tRNA(Gln) amidotransferase subunit E-like FAD-binding protein